MKVGIPMLKLNAANLQPVIREAWIRDNAAERNCSDPDYDPSRTAANVYLVGPQRATAVVQKIEERKLAYEQLQGRKLRKDAVLSVAGIIKPNGDAFRTYSHSDQMRFFRDSFEILDSPEFFNGNIDAFVIQVDEGVPHVHFVATPIAEDGSWSAKKVLNLKLLNRLNSLYPAKMREKGWDVDSIAQFDQDAYRAMSPEEKNAYVQAKKKRKTNHGISAARYKAEREAVKIREAVSQDIREMEDAARRRLEAAEAVTEERQKAAAVYEEAAEKASKALQEARKELQATKLAIRKEEAALANLEVAVDDMRDSFEKYSASIPDDYEVMRSKALDVLLDWIPLPAAEAIKRGLNWISARYRETGIWPRRRKEAPHRWPGSGEPERAPSLRR